MKSLGVFPMQASLARWESRCALRMLCTSAAISSKGKVPSFVQLFSNSIMGTKWSRCDNFVYGGIE